MEVQGALGVYFLTSSTGPRRGYQCLYCEGLFEGKRILDEHYLEAHEEAFSQEELDMARSRPSRLELAFRRSPLGWD